MNDVKDQVREQVIKSMEWYVVMEIKPQIRDQVRPGIRPEVGHVLTQICDQLEEEGQ